MSGSQSALIGGGSLPIGAHIPMPGAPAWYQTGGREYLRAGALLTYSAGYADSIAAVPGLRVFGNNANSYSPGSASGNRNKYFRVGANYVGIEQGSSSVSYASALSGPWSAGTGMTGVPSAASGYYNPAAVNGTNYLVCASSDPNTAPVYTSDGAAFSSVGGTFTTFPANCSVGYGNSYWVAAAVLDGTAKIGYIANANPSGGWTVATSANLSMTIVSAIVYGASVFCVVGTSSSATAGKIVTFSNPGGTWTDRTSTCGIVFQTNESIRDCVFDGTAFVALTSTGRIIKATDPTGTWTDCGVPLDMGTTGLVGTATAHGQPKTLTTDGAGIVIASCAIPSTGISPDYISSDHGVTWAAMQIYGGKATYGNSGVAGTSYTNGQWIFNKSFAVAGLVNPSSFSAPDYIGWQFQSYFGEMVRIK